MQQITLGDSVKYLNKLSVYISIVGGCIVGYLGGYDLFLRGLLILVVIDYLTGLLKAFNSKSLNSQVGREGIIKKVFIFLIVAVSTTIQGIVDVPIREVTIMFLIGNEGISILENSSGFVPIPQKLINVLEQLRGDPK